ncbi:MAG: TIGR01777 family oxidoreductase [Jatrophihabitantaceae bacterium]
MSITASSVVNAPLNEVFAWHERPGALARLLPPWQPIRARREATNLRDGRAELALPGGLRWVAQHSNYDPPHRFVDELDSLPLRWRHEHRFEQLDEVRTRVSDRVDTPIPAAMLRATFAYRHRQLADDLDTHAAARSWRAAPLSVAVTGSSGLVGSALCALLTTGGHRVIHLVRRPVAGPDERTWQPDDPDPHLLDGVDAVAHLAGASIAGRFSDAHKRAIYDSRVNPTRRLAESAASGGVGVFVCASAIGVYGPDRGDELLGEDADRGSGFLAGVVADWEAAASGAAEAGLRIVQVRTGIVQSPRGGTLQIFRPLFAAGLGGPIGDGAAWLSWIGLDDLTDIYLRALLDERLSGPVNAVAPLPVTSADYARTLGHVLHRPALLSVPTFGPKLLLGAESARELALASQRVEPSRLTSLGHRWRHPELAQALAHQLGKASMPAGGQLQ